MPKNIRFGRSISIRNVHRNFLHLSDMIIERRLSTVELSIDRISSVQKFAANCYIYIDIISSPSFVYSDSPTTFEFHQNQDRTTF